MQVRAFPAHILFSFDVVRCDLKGVLSHIYYCSLIFWIIIACTHGGIYRLVVLLTKVLPTESYQWGSDSGDKYWNGQADVDGNKLGNNTCNILRGTDGNQFPPGVQKENPLWIFNPAPCRFDEC